MTEHVYNKMEIVGSSKTGIEDAVNNAVETASKTVKNLRWFEVVETRGYIEHGRVSYYQVTIKIGHTAD